MERRQRPLKNVGIYAAGQSFPWPCADEQIKAGLIACGIEYNEYAISTEAMLEKVMAQQPTKQIIGQIDIVDCIPATELRGPDLDSYERYRDPIHKNRINWFGILRNPRAWVKTFPIRVNKMIIWVKVDPACTNPENIKEPSCPQHSTRPQ